MHQNSSLKKKYLDALPFFQATLFISQIPCISVISTLFLFLSVLLTVLIKRRTRTDLIKRRSRPYLPSEVLSHFSNRQGFIDLIRFRSCCRQEMYDVQTVINETEELSMAEKRRPWSDLPSELLSQISNRLGLIDLLRFRSVCKHWNFSSSTSTAAPESSPGRSPWFLVYGGGDGSSCRWTGDSGEKFAVHMPDLDGGATCLASSHGWLLVLQSQSGSIFFLCPFSRARINLPNLDKSELSGSDGLVAAFSAPPPSRDCVVAVVRRKSVLRLRMSLIRRGEELWSAFEFNVTLPKTVDCGVFRGGSFYFFDRNDGLAIFSLEDRKLKTYRLVSGNEAKVVKDSLPFICRRYHLNDTKKLAEVPFDASISTCGTYVAESNGLDSVVFNEDFGAIGEEDSSTPRLKGVWMHPRFFAKSKDDITW